MLSMGPVWQPGSAPGRGPRPPPHEDRRVRRPASASPRMLGNVDAATAARFLGPLIVEPWCGWHAAWMGYVVFGAGAIGAVVGGFYRTCVIDEILEHSPAEYVRRPNVPPESPTLGLSHLQLEALLTAARTSDNRCDFALVCTLGLLGLRIFEACSLDIADLGEEHGHRVPGVVGKGHKVVLVPLPPAVARSVERAIADRAEGPLLLNTQGHRLDRHSATRRLRRLAENAGVRLPRMHHPRPAPELHPRRLHGLRNLSAAPFVGDERGIRAELVPALPRCISHRYHSGMSTQIAVRLSDDLVAFVDDLVTQGDATSRAAVVSRALERERRRKVAERDAAILARTGADADLDSLAQYAASTPMGDLD